ncbi:MAG: hypothetical protein WCC90_01010 [Methylocella sp.]
MAGSQEPLILVTVGLKPSGIAVTPDGTQVYVTNSSGGTVSVIDTSTNTVAATIPVGVGPIGSPSAWMGSTPMWRMGVLAMFR